MEVERVQALATVGLDTLPAQFIRPSHEWPENSRAIDGITVPVISLSQPHHALVREIHEVCCEWGSFLVTDHGITPELIRQLQEAGREFFRLPQEEKEKYANNPSRGNFEGYGTKMTKNHDAKVEWVDYFFHVMHPPCKVRHEIWPHQPPSYRVERRVTQLELEIKINLYSSCPQPQLALGVEPHTDTSAPTILVPNEVPGLQAWKDGSWYVWYTSALTILAQCAFLPRWRSN